MDEAAGCNALHFSGNRRGNNFLVAVFCSQGRNVVGSVQQRNHRLHRIRVCDRCQRRFQLCRFDRDPQNVARGNLGCLGNRSIEVAERTLEMNLRRIFGKPFATNHHRDRRAVVGDAGCDESSDSAGTENGMSNLVGHAGLLFAGGRGGNTLEDLRLT